MITNLLPGLRDLRTPLATGYLWIVGLWLLIHQHVPRTARSATGPIRSLYELGNIVGHAAALAALTFVAYIVGSILAFKFGTNTNLLLRIRSQAPLVIRHYRMITEYVLFASGYINAIQLTSQLQGFTQPILDNARKYLTFDELSDVPQQGGRSTVLAARYVRTRRSAEIDLRDTYVHAVIEDFPAVGIQLQAKDRDLWDTYDRQQAEAHFRLAISLPIIFIFSALTAESGQLLWLFLLIVPVILIFSGLRTSVAASAVLVQAVVLNLVEPPILERLATEVAEAKLEGRRINPGP
jgi:hypothetical protein